jgi:putative FmdB family regulatory protein
LTGALQGRFSSIVSPVFITPLYSTIEIAIINYKERRRCIIPTYDYVCKACDHKFDELQKFSDPVLTKCPKCKKKQLERLLGNGAGFIVRGSTCRFENSYGSSLGGREVPMDSAEQKFAERMAQLNNEE